ncbi:TIGR02186 family protein [Candidatus Deianiraea vastatrix]|uniref:Transmembrane protein (Alph_Pro_TM) n=1 Tax=Candidatus Deianiraea vastatrix TaxID=2163644 RepID=A0A5B8XK31_9RICK|nr:TIGR02186 family protein [Candidatus Deianiraea vastatrix]QED23847.1 Putative transmembrane protein (Alph_Pro_TM) [Candidatus Deianiraea vastatrix]
MLYLVNKSKTINIIIAILVIIFSSAFSPSKCKNDFNISKRTIIVGDIFSGKTLSTYGILCNNKNKYSIATHLDGKKYNIKKAKKNKIGMVYTSDEKQDIEYFGYLHSFGENLFTQYLQYPNNTILNYNLKMSGLLTHNKTINANQNGLFKERIYIPKTAKPGVYLSEFYVFDSKNVLKEVYIKPFNVVLQGNGGVIYNIMQNQRILYIIISILSIIGVSFAVNGILDIFKK